MRPICRKRADGIRVCVRACLYACVRVNVSVCANVLLHLRTKMVFYPNLLKKIRRCSEVNVNAHVQKVPQQNPKKTLTRHHKKKGAKMAKENSLKNDRRTSEGTVNDGEDNTGAKQVSVLL